MQEEQTTRLQHNMGTLVRLSRHEGYCDITFHDRDPLIGVRLSPALNAALMYGAGARKMTEMLDRIETRDGDVFRAVDVWVIVEFPNGLPSDEDLARVDLADGEAEVAPAFPCGRWPKRSIDVVMTWRRNECFAASLPPKIGRARCCA